MRPPVVVLHHIIRPDPMTQAAKGVTGRCGRSSRVTKVRHAGTDRQHRIPAWLLRGVQRMLDVSVTLRNLVEGCWKATSITAVEVLPNEPQTGHRCGFCWKTPRGLREGWLGLRRLRRAITADGLTTMQLAPDSGRRSAVYREQRSSVEYVSECATADNGALKLERTGR